MSRSQATYHLGYELDGQQPVISVHADPAYFKDLLLKSDHLRGVQEYLGLASDFTHHEEAFGYGGIGRLEESSKGLGWMALKLTIPKAKSNGRGISTPTPELLPVVSTLSVALGHLNNVNQMRQGNPNNSQLITVDLENTVPHDEYHSAHISAQLTPDMLTWLELLPDVQAAQERVKGALQRSFEYPYTNPRENDEFWVRLGDVISFTYPGDGTGFSAWRSDADPRKGLRINAMNNDHPIQQVAILGGLAALNDIVLEL